MAAELTNHSLLGTVVTVSVDSGRFASSRRIARRVLRRMGELERVFNLHDPESAITQLRRTGTTTDPSLLEVLGLASRWYLATEGLFHPCASRGPNLPWAASGARIEFTGDCSEVDLNAIAKGWIADRAADSVSRFTRLVIDAGGDIVHRGRPELGVGVEDPVMPYDNVDPIATAVLRNASIATSGTARRGKHLRAPIATDATRAVASASVVAPKAADADAAATALAAASFDTATDLAERLGLDSLVVADDGSVAISGTAFGLSGVEAERSAQRQPHEEDRHDQPGRGE